MRTRAAYTMLELITVLALSGLAAGIVWPVGRGTLDRFAVNAVRQEVAAAILHTRLTARGRGGASLTLTPDSGLVQLLVRDSVVRSWSGARDGGVGIETGGAGGRVVLRFDALGLGVVTSRTLVFTRGDAEARLVISSRGRAVRR